MPPPFVYLKYKYPTYELTPHGLSRVGYLEGPVQISGSRQQPQRRKDEAPKAVEESSGLRAAAVLIQVRKEEARVSRRHKHGSLKQCDICQVVHPSQKPLLACTPQGAISALAQR